MPIVTFGLTSMVLFGLQVPHFLLLPGPKLSELLFKWKKLCYFFFLIA